MAVDMTRPAFILSLGSEFDDFLFAPLGEDGNGMRLSVLSALARQDVDPWQEAARLAQLPKETAVQRLVSLIAGLPGRSATELGVAAERLIGLLPRQTGPNRVAASAVAGGVNRSRMVVSVLLLVLLLAAQCWLIGRQPRMTIDGPSMPASIVAMQPVLPLNFGQ
ncbi:hypothetical protein [Telmatospirillum sp.]|uniref:hypothetical protein n=1 Tax=Telmatospirillum sp. TaxID=2079197 RepID=UPI002845EFE8|nr:hypothetical protein [Telmatospirillum sp.]MDR3436945.1 hypothetical protein [Telmatospirillum sp.]